MSGLKKKYVLKNGTVLLLRFADETGACVGVRYHGYRRGPVPTIVFVLAENAKRLTQKDVAKAASRVMGSSAVLTERQLELSTRSAVTRYSEALEMADTFVKELNKLLEARQTAKAVAAKSEAKAARTIRRR